MTLSCSKKVLALPSGGTSNNNDDFIEWIVSILREQKQTWMV